MPVLDRDRPVVAYCYCHCGARFLAADCAGGKIPEHRAAPSPFDVPGYRPGPCPDAGRAPLHVGDIV